MKTNTLTQSRSRPRPNGVKAISRLCSPNLGLRTLVFAAALLHTLTLIGSPSYAAVIVSQDDTAATVSITSVTPAISAVSDLQDTLGTTATATLPGYSSITTSSYDPTGFSVDFTQVRGGSIASSAFGIGDVVFFATSNGSYTAGGLFTQSYGTGYFESYLSDVTAGGYLYHAIGTSNLPGTETLGSSLVEGSLTGSLVAGHQYVWAVAGEITWFGLLDELNNTYHPDNGSVATGSAFINFTSEGDGGGGGGTGGNAAVPEPTSLALWGLGALGCAFGAFRRPNRSSLFSLLPLVQNARPARRSRQSRLNLERLEERTVLSSFAAGFGGAGTDVPNPPATDPSGNTYLSGYFSSQPADFDPGPGVMNLSSAGGNDVFVAKYAADGSLAWARSFGGTSDDQGSKVAYSAEGTNSYLYVTGNFQGSVDFGPGVGTLTSAGGYDVFLLKLDAQTGAAVWGESLGGSSADSTYDLAVAGGNVYLTGAFNGTVDFDPSLGGTANLSDTDGHGFVWTLDANGNYVSAFALPAVVGGITIDGSSVYLEGRFSGTVDFDPGPGVQPRTSVGVNNVFVAQYSNAGLYGWVQTMQVVEPVFGKIAQDGTSVYIATTGMTTNGGDNAVVASFSKADGSLAWLKQIGGANTVLAATCVVNATTGTLYVGGGFTSNTVDFNPGGTGGVVANAGSSGTQDGYVLELNLATGDFQQVWRLGGVGNDVARIGDVRGTTVYVSGNFESTANFPNSGTLTSQGGKDVFFMALDVTDPVVPTVPVTKFYVANDGSTDRTYEYAIDGTVVENYSINSGNTAPRGAASTAAGTKVWVVDANKNVYVYNTSGGLLGSWAAGSMPSNAIVEGVTTNGTDVWIVDRKSEKVYRYANAASLLSGSQNAASSFNLSSSNSTPKDLVTDGTSIWVVNDSSTDKIFKYTVSGSLLGSWTINAGGGSPTGITIDPASVSNIWIVDSNTDRVYQFDAATTRTSGSQSPSTSFALSAGNTNPQGIADPPVPTLTRGLSEKTSVATVADNHAAFDTALLAITDELTDLIGASKRRR